MSFSEKPCEYKRFMEKRYPEELHDLHNNYPLAPEKMVIGDNFKVSQYHKIQYINLKKIMVLI